MNCKPGDLAIIIKTLGSQRGTGANIGRICRVLYSLGVGKTSIGPLFLWQVEMVGSPGIDASLQPCRIGQVPDMYLRPILPGEEAQHTSQPERETA